MKLSDEKISSLQEMEKHQAKSSGAPEPLKQRFGHQSRLPDILYPLSFAGPLTPLWVSPKLFFAHPWVLYSIGLAGVMLASACLPVFAYLIGIWLNGVINLELSAEEREQVGLDSSMMMLGPLLAAFVGSFTWFFCFGRASSKLSKSIRIQYFSSILAQDSTYFDKNGCGEITTRADKDIDTINVGYGEKLGWVLWLSFYVISNITVAFISLPKLAAVLFPFFVWVVAFFYLIEKTTKRQQARAEAAQGLASTFLEQCLSGVRVIQTFGMAKPLMKRWDGRLLKDIETLRTMPALVRAVEIAWCHFAMGIILCVTVHYSTTLAGDGYKFGSMFNTMICFTAMHFVLYNRLESITGFRSAIACIKVLRHHMERQPFIDIRKESGVELGPFSSDCAYTPTMALQGVTFAYPSRPHIKALDDVTFTAEAGQLTAFVGPSGAGKSSIAGLLVRQYDPMTANLLNPHDAEADAEKKRYYARLGDIQSSSSIEEGHRGGTGSNSTFDPMAGLQVVRGGGIAQFDGIDLRNYNLRSLRSRISVVHQEPQLLAGSVFENIAAGLMGTTFQYRKEVDGKDEEKVSLVRQLCEDALRKAEALEFVRELPEGIDTQITGGRSGILSGGQQQRLAIARALVGNPAVLILDEATSALSSDVELKIRNNLEDEQRKRGMTIISIAHRLQFAQLAHKIIVMEQGRVVDTGTYSELASADRPNQTFARLVHNSPNKQEAIVATIPLEEVTKSSASSDNKSLSEVSSSTSGKNTVVVHSAQGVNENHSAESRSGSPSRRKLGFFHFATARRLPFYAMLAFGVINAALRVHFQFQLGRTNARLSGYVDSWSLLAYTLFWVGYAFSWGSVTYAQESLAGINEKSLQRRLLAATAESLFQQEISYFEEEAPSVGTLTASLSKHTSVIAETATISLMRVGALALAGCGTLLMGLILGWKFGIMVFPFILFSGAIGRVQTFALGRAEKLQEESQNAVSTLINEAVDSIATIAILGQESEFVQSIALHSQEPLQARKWRILQHATQALGESTAFAVACLLHWWGARLYVRGEISPSSFYTIYEGAFGVIFLISPLLQYLNSFGRARHGWSILKKYINREPRFATKKLSALQADSVDEAMHRDIVYHDVSMRYPKRKDYLALDRLNLRLRGGQVNAITGTSGGGKSTILALLQRFYEPTGGCMEFGGVDSQAVPLATLRSHMAIVSQNSVLFEGDIRFNLSLGARDPENVLQAELEFVCQQACILDFVNSLPEGFNTDIGLKGTRLSGGQRQRLCIARALLRSPSILLLDEATSSLDAVNEAEVEKALQNASKGRTTIVVAHKLQSIRNADQIFVIADGKLVESGTHDDLVNKGEQYYGLVKSQL